MAKKLKTNKSQVIRKLHDLGHDPKEIQKMTNYSKPLINIVLRNYKAKKKARKSKIVKDVTEMKKALDAIAPKKDRKAEAWAKKNPWFGEDKDKTGYALVLHSKLVDAGVDPKSDEYYQKIDEGMSKFESTLTVSERKIAKKLGLDPDHDPVNHPLHYRTGGVETIDFIEAKDLNYRLGNVVKYVSRAGRKGDPLQDLEKAAWYLQREITARKNA